MPKEQNTSEHLRHCLLFLFDSGKSVKEAEVEVSKTYGSQAMSQRTIRRWYSLSFLALFLLILWLRFDKFRSGDRSFLELDRSERPSDFGDDFDEQLKATVNLFPDMAIRELAEVIWSTKSTIARHLHLLGMVSSSFILTFILLLLF